MTWVHERPEKCDLPVYQVFFRSLLPPCVILSDSHDTQVPCMRRKGFGHGKTMEDLFMDPKPSHRVRLSIKDGCKTQRQLLQD
ncbi:hypothetical protein CDEST_05492 [Colletotrichum destructivum]|uniref:Uncharacterized protein n=1 Tax=Colletotrichum destructivum TaxID=34406 RepID=A0AAX4IAT2_9PEZI|nr:hypothetical protein CDEST_05492 [Colletotrichum destructivum]